MPIRPCSHSGACHRQACPGRVLQELPPSRLTGIVFRPSRFGRFRTQSHPTVLSLIVLDSWHANSVPSYCFHRVRPNSALTVIFQLHLPAATRRQASSQAGAHGYSPTQPLASSVTLNRLGSRTGLEATHTPLPRKWPRWGTCSDKRLGPTTLPLDENSMSRNFSDFVGRRSDIVLWSNN